MPRLAGRRLWAVSDGGRFEWDCVSLNDQTSTRSAHGTETADPSSEPDIRPTVADLVLRLAGIECAARPLRSDRRGGFAFRTWAGGQAGAITGRVDPARDIRSPRTSRPHTGRSEDRKARAKVCWNLPWSASAAQRVETSARRRWCCACVSPSVRSSAGDPDLAPRLWAGRSLGDPWADGGINKIARCTNALPTFFRSGLLSGQRCFGALHSWTFPP
jgi:hypothetical protein